MSKGWYPVIDYDKCVGCMACNDMCRHGVYKPDTETGKPKVVYGTGCVHGCHGCEKKCPVGAIHYFGDDGTLDIDYNFETYRPTLDCEGKPKVAFVCVHNSCRSQIAEALGKRLASDVFESYSAGTELKDHINPDAVRLMKQIYGIDMEQTQYNKLISDIPAPDVVIFMGCNVSCPNVSSQYAENWRLDDPSGQSDKVFEETKCFYAFVYFEPACWYHDYSIWFNIYRCCLYLTNNLKHFYRAGQLISVIGSALCVAIYVIFPHPLCKLFGADAETIGFTEIHMWEYCWGFVIGSMNTMLSAYFYSTKRSSQAIVLNIVRSLIMNSLIITFLPKIFGSQLYGTLLVSMKYLYWL